MTGCSLFGLCLGTKQGVWALIKFPRKTWTVCDDELLREMYKQRLPISIMVERLQRSRPSILTRAYRQGISGHQHGKRGLAPAKRDFFKDGSNLRAAYLAGLIAADGGIRSDLNTVTIGLRVSDADVLFKIAADLQMPSSAVKFYTRKTPGGKSVSATLYVCGAAGMISDLGKNYGVVSSKVEISLPNWICSAREAFWSFLVGFIEGDGNISNRGGFYPAGVELTSESVSLLEDINRCLASYGYKNQKLQRITTRGRNEDDPRKVGKAKRLRYAGKDAAGILVQLCAVRDNLGEPICRMDRKWKSAVAISSVTRMVHLNSFVPTGRLDKDLEFILGCAPKEIMSMPCRILNEVLEGEGGYRFKSRKERFEAVMRNIPNTWVLAEHRRAWCRL